jgi:hypothetical protein
MPRLNLLIPSVRRQGVFGGVDTAMALFFSLCRRFGAARIIVTGDHVPARATEIALKEMMHDRSWLLPESVELTIECPRSRTGSQPFDVSRNDFFMATSWVTAYLGLRLVNWQKRAYEIAGSPMLYLIQDYEPGFYAGSSRSALAETTYMSDTPVVAVYNSHELASYFARRGYRFHSSHVLEPLLNSTLDKERTALMESAPKRTKTLLVYARPSVQRNAFDLAVEAVRFWQREYDGAGEWRVFGVGESFGPIRIGAGTTIRSLGKLSLHQYAVRLATSRVGLSLMMSPHPSYPPLEMAAFGMRVITNGFLDKDLSARSQNIVSVLVPTPENLGRALIEACKASEAGPDPHWDHPFRSGSWDELRTALLRDLNGDISGLDSRKSD